MKKILLLLLFLIKLSNVHSQKELWGYKNYLGFQPNNPSLSNGQIIKVPLIGNNSIAEIMHTFDPIGVLGKYPRGRLFQASNGKLYGVTGLLIEENFGGIVPNSVLFEYDLVLNKYKVITQLNYPNAGVIEPLPEILMGTTNNGNSVYKYNINTGVFAIMASIPSFFIPDLSSGTTYYPGAICELFKASDGNLYYTTSVSRNDPPSIVAPQPGGIYKYNLTTNTISKVYYFGQDDFNPSAIFDPAGYNFVEGSPGKLYNITQSGYINYNPNAIFQYGYGVLYEFDIYTNTVSIKYEYDYYTLGAEQGQLQRVSNTKILGTTYNYTGNLTNIPYRNGVIYEYDIPSNTVSLKHAINFQTDDFVYNISGFSNLASDGNYYNTSYSSIYRYNPTTNIINKKIAATGDGNLQEMIEVCRKPAYQEILVNTFTANVGGVFTYNVQNINATSYQWQLNGSNVTGQTTGVLNLTNITAANAGVYTCVMTNECGTTTTAPLTLTVANLGTNSVANLDKAIQLVPNPATNFITIELPKNIDVQINNLKINDMLGKEVYTSNENKTKIDVSKLPKGIYIISLKTNYGVWNGKFLKE